MITANSSELRKTGVDVVGDMPWGTHFCLFYDTKADLLEIAVCYCKAGLQSGEFCLWVVAPPVTEQDALQALHRAVPDFDRYLLENSIEVVAARDWYLQDGKFDLKRVIAGWNDKLARASAKGYAGVRVTGDTAWLERKDWNDFCEYEDSLNGSIANQRLAVLCTYPLAACGAGEILDVVRTHQFAVTKRRGSWDVIETAGYKQAKAEISDLQEREKERERLRQALSDLAHISRVTTMGQLTASLAHEIKQPITAAVTDAKTCLRWLGRDQPDLAGAREAATRAIADVTRASEIISRIGLLFKKEGSQRELLDVNAVIEEMIVLLRSEASRYTISIRTALANDLPKAMADRVQLQQVLMNLMLNGIDAIKGSTPAGEVTITSLLEDGQLAISVHDTGPGLAAGQADQIFEAFFTTKADGTGMGLTISRSIVESHGGRLSVMNFGSGATFRFTLPVPATAQHAA